MPIKLVGGVVTYTPADQMTRFLQTGVIWSTQFAIEDSIDQLKQINFDSSSASTNTTLTFASQQTSSGTLLAPNIGASDTIATLNVANVFTQNITAPNISGSNTGNVTLGATATSGGMTLTGASGQQLNMSQASGSTNGWLSSTDWTNFSTTVQQNLTVKNTSGSTINKGQCVYITGFDSGSGAPTVSLAQANSTATMPSIGLVVSSSIANNATGSVQVAGVATNLNTSGLTVGQVAYVSQSAAGSLQSTYPTISAGNHNVAQMVGVVVQSDATNGQIYIVAQQPDQLQNGTIADNFFIGSGQAGTKTIVFNAGASASGTLQMTPTAARTVTFPDSSYTLAALSLIQTFTQANTFSLPGAANTAPMKLSGAPFSGGTATSTKPLFWIENAANSNAWSTSGTIIGANPATGFAGNLIDLQINASSKFSVNSSGNVTAGTYNGLTVTSTTGTFTLTNGKTLSVSNSLTLAGTDSTTMTFPSTSDTVVTLTATQTLTNKTLTTPIIASISNSGTITIPTGTDTLVGRATTDTLTNKRITKRVVAGGTLGSSGATVTITGDTADVYTITQFAGGTAVTIGAPSGTPTDGQPLELVFTNSTAGTTYTWNAIFTGSTSLALPTTSTANKVDKFIFQYNAATSKWNLIGMLQGF